MGHCDLILPVDFSYTFNINLPALRVNIAG